MRRWLVVLALLVVLVGSMKPLYAGRMYDPELGRFATPDPALNTQNPNELLKLNNGTLLSISPYVYVANNPLKYVDPDGRILKPVQMIGFSREAPGLKERAYLIDAKIADAVVSFVKEAQAAFPELAVNNAFRLEPSSSISTTNTKAVGLSRHQAGFAIDLNGVKKLSKEELEKLNKIAEKHGFAPLKDQEKDLPHFSADPTEHGYQSLEEAVDENKKDYYDRFQNQQNDSGTGPH